MKKEHIKKVYEALEVLESVEQHDTFEYRALLMNYLKGWLAYYSKKLYK